MIATEEQKTALYEDYSKKVQSYIVSKVLDADLAEELCANVFLKVYEKLASFDETKAAISTWIYTIARNTLIDYYRTRKVFGEIPEDLRGEGSPEESLCNQEMLETLADALEQLEDRERDIIVLRYYSGHTLKEIGEHLGISYTYVKILHNKALDKLKEFF